MTVSLSRHLCATNCACAIRCSCFLFLTLHSSFGGPPRNEEKCRSAADDDARIDDDGPIIITESDMEAEAVRLALVLPPLHGSAYSKED